MPPKLWTCSLRRWLLANRPIAYQHTPPSTVATFTTLTERQNANHVMPILSAERSNGTSEDISEEELYRYTRNRWMHMSERYLKFDLQELLKAAVTSVSSEGARYCTRVFKCREGLNNKAYLLTMDNGSEVFAKLPSPIAGPAYYTTASEVATREFLRGVLNIPTPRIVAWSADRNNNVGAEYILEEKAPGKPLGSLWYQWPMDFKLEMISQIVEIERQLASTKFVRSGCIYFREDIPDNMCCDNAILTSGPLDSSVLDRFQLGPLVSSGLWRGVRASMDLNRGPYNGQLEFVEAMATNEIRFIETHAHPRKNYHRSSTETELPDEVLDLLNRYLQLASAMVPPSGTDDTDFANALASRPPS
ncbi:uncharacterized protein RCO7_10124 [Rhynchosporium graminicola]|uniref:Altered inheritance of mitochondria protein 9, mitochondrial n=1 Tax=Rhynchosporium graminicola TaxID=2792576 RepID=A0A1E1K8I6_9HELO|nr:uncharacterized protein RCO7_10124 [Rhynchosporium commune]